MSDLPVHQTTARPGRRTARGGRREARRGAWHPRMEEDPG
jgi:hypothetical protein